ncbi:hypothetical protein LTR99_005115 [Exophiala xenobiotica]|uniref:Uncharacterized protein n=1 Tax=Vermiconidia calcicola TaxID=1690605 RepID=A0AAV9QIV6_9PEZI|nr:hypothetical protein H2202_005484 [Exophiala xenobiotica]KAK5536419.1 hypothetical protein LTR23_007853 [Chaetothyriales sp. CCFEE 6169]KAK5541404.1 hypothetical protein LTR25_003181 [Vermiconidia calcicola]KAK5196324.1 hypothetical protein LTR92_003869 [Exophiala xenobiotica]KAK5214256.1 hypothetical protein LTR41_000448 [Exophiala xenobiotica]
MEEIPVFRSAKRRKVARPRHADSSEPTTDQTSATATATEVVEDRDEKDEIELSDLIRARKNYRKPAGGVHFSTTRDTPDNGQDHGISTVFNADQGPVKPIDISGRFVSSTGQVVDVDQHMVAFVDSEMAKKRALVASISDEQQRQQQHGTRATPEAPQGSVAAPPKSPAQIEQSSNRQLSEIDLGSSAHARNLARTQAALERAKAGLPPVEDEPKPPRPRRPRLGRDGKPMRPRPRKRRNSDDAARDALVEQLMRENKLDIYEGNELLRRTERQAEAKSGDEYSDDSGADERMAEQFRQNFMDAMAERQQKGKVSTQAKASTATESRGPKLGGSRSARAKMAQMQQQSQAPGKK